MAKINSLLKDEDMVQEAETVDDPIMPSSGKRSYTLPVIRFTNLFLSLVIIDGILSIVLWLTGGTSEYFVDNIIHFHLRESVFDLALMVGVKVFCVLTLLPYLEHLSHQQVDHPYDNVLKQRSRLCHILLILFNFVFFAFATTKGGLILYSVINDSSYVPMHRTYNALVISAITFSMLQFLMSLLSFRFMKKLKVIRVLHLYNDLGQEVDEDGELIKKKASIGRLVTLGKPEFGLIFVGTFALLFSSGSQMAAPLFFGKVVDAAQRSMSELTKTVVILLIIYIIGCCFGMLRAYCFTLAGQRLVARLRKRLFGQIVEQEVAFFDVTRTGELCNRLSSDTQVIQNAATVNISMLVRYSLQMIGSLVFMFVLNPALTGVLLAVVPIVSLCTVQYGKFVKRLSQQFQDKLADAGTLAEENISSIRTVRTFSGENKAHVLYGDEIEKSYKIGKKLALAYGLFEGVAGVLSYGAISLVLWYGGKLVYENSHGGHTGLTPGVLTSFLLYTLQVAMSFALMSSLYGDFMKAVGASTRIFDLLDRVPKVPVADGIILPFLNGRVVFNEIHFTYPSRPESEVLKGITFTVQPGEMVALVGPSGGGKSTIVNLIERFYDPDSGSITLGDVDLRSLDPQWFRQKISMVSQEPSLFACSIKDNIAYGRNATYEEIEQAAKDANAHEFINSFEEKYDTLVGEKGVRLSGGQKQRIAIARALIMDPVLLLLDEATSALDAESEHLVQEAIDRAMKGRTVIVIAHRLSTVRNASKVVVIEGGRIAEVGTHDELLAMNGVYQKLVLRQLTAGSLQSEDIDNNK